MTQRVRACAVCVHDDELLCVRLRDPHSKIARLFVPGGRIEDGETAPAAAARETREETGYLVEVEPRSELIASYPYVWAGHEIACQTHFFWAGLRSDRARPALVRDASYHEGVVWLPRPAWHELAFSAEIYAAVCAVIGAHGLAPSGWLTGPIETGS